MDVQRNRDAAAWTAKSPRPLLSASSGPGFAAASSSLVGGTSEGGLLATFDAIFRQTLSAEPSSLEAATLAHPSDHAAPADYAAPTPSGPSATSPSSTASDGDEEEQDDEERRTEPSAATLRSQAAPPNEATPQAVDSDEQLAANDPDALGADAAAERESEEETEPELTGELIAERDAGAAELAGDGSEESADSPQATEDQVSVVASEPASPLAGATPLPTPAGEAAPQESVVESPSTTLEATAQAGGSTDGEEGERARPATEQPLPTAASQEGEASAARVAAGEPASAQEETPRSEESQPVAEETSQETEAADGNARSGRDSGKQEENRQHERNGDEQRQAGGQRSAEPTSRERAIDNLVAQMQPVESPADAPATPVGTPSTGAAQQPLAGAAAAVAAPAATSTAAKAEGVESTATSGDRLGLDSGESRRSVGSVKAESGEGRVQGGSNADRVRLVQRVARAFQRLGPDGGRVQVMLHPAELGSVRLDLRIEGQRMEARMTAESEAARSVLREHLPELRQRLAESGLTVERIEIEADGRTGSEGRREGEAAFRQGERQGQGSGESFSWQRGRQNSGPLGRPAPAAPATAAAASSGPFASRTSLDFVA